MADRDRGGPYVPCPTLDRLYSQRSLGPTPFASEKLEQKLYEPPKLLAQRDLHKKSELFQCKMTYPVALVSAEGSTEELSPPRDENNFFHPAGGPYKMKTNQTLAQAPNQFWQIPPPTLDRAEDPRKPKQVLPRDTFHPLLSAQQAAENMKAAQFNPQVAYLANASRKGPPCEAHQIQSKHIQSAVGAESGGGNEMEQSGEMEDDDDLLETTGPSITKQFSKSSKRGDPKTAAGRAYNAEGGFWDPDQYSSKIIEFASTQPQSITAMAAKALASAIHDRPSHAIPANVMKSRARRCEPNSGPTGTNTNRHEYVGLNDAKNTLVPPSPAFRNLSSEVQATLLKRDRDCRHKVARVLETKFPSLHPTPDEPEAGVNPDEVQYQSAVYANRKVPFADPNDFEELDFVADEDIDPIEALGHGTSLAIWNIVLRRKAGRLQTLDDPIQSTLHPVNNVVLNRRLKVLTPQLISCYNSSSSRGEVNTFLNGIGLKMGDSLAQTKPPSQSSFMRTEDITSKIKQYTNIAYTPSNAFGFDSQRLKMVLGDKGREIEEIFLEGCNWLSNDSLADIGKFCANLKLLNLADCAQLTDETLTLIVSRCNDLAYLNISGCANITGASLIALFNNCPNLYALCMSRLPNINISADVAFLQMHRIPRLAVLDVSYCSNITDAVLISAAQHCRCLEILDISGCFKLTDTGVGSIACSAAALKIWRLKLCSQLTAASLSILATAPRNMFYLDIAGMEKLEPRTFEHIVKKLPCLRQLSISGCLQLDDTAINSITQYCKNLTLLNLSSCIGVGLHSCMELIHELGNLRKLIVSESSISNAEVATLSAMRESCHIVRNQARPKAPMKLVGYKQPEAKPKPKTTEKKGKK